MFMAQRLRLQAVLICGSRGVDDERWRLDDGTGVAEWISAGRRMAPDLRVEVVCGAGYERDQRTASEIGRLLGVIPIAMASPHGEEVGHNMLFPQLVAGSLSQFLVYMLGLQ